MEKNWIPAPTPEAIITHQLSEALNIEPVLSKLLAQRGIRTFEEARAFFRPDLEELHDPFLMRDMDRAVRRLEEALENGEKILVYGDYDVDGTTAVTIMYSFLHDLGVACDYYIPDRYTEGYGFSMKGVDYAYETGCDLIITLDCGVRDGVKIDYAAGKGIDVIVCDHHQPAQIPNAAAVLDPKRPDCNYPFKGLCGAGVGFKLLQALCIQKDLDRNKLFQYLDLLTIAIAADIVPVSGENRILAYHGLKQLQHTERPGIRAMLNNAGFKKDQLTITDVVFILAPRINAAGRIFSGKKAVELLLCQSAEDAAPVAAAIEEYNTTRKTLDKGITEEALQKVSDDDFYHSALSIVVAGENWHKGVVGIVAARLVETHYKPTIVLVSDGEKMAGSARSISGIDLFECLSECEDLLEQFGGHTMAAGLSLKAANFEQFRSRFDEVIRKKLNNIKPIPQLSYDAEIDFSEIGPKLMRILKQFEPFGPENMHPVFLSEKVENHRFTRTVGDQKNHLKLHVHQQHTPSLALDGIGFDLGHWEKHLLQQLPVDLLFALDENTWNNKTTIQLVVKDIRSAE
ncbi:MAG: single-stranded-DNA-specific exonuclease RecJ [Flavobacteriales bacterium]|jgi:single-stranded-DNA-specific exonuclease